MFYDGQEGHFIFSSKWKQQKKRVSSKPTDEVAFQLEDEWFIQRMENLEKEENSKKSANSSLGGWSKRKTPSKKINKKHRQN